MTKQIFLATNNHGKIERFKNFVKHTGLDVEILTPDDLNIEDIHVDENADTLAGNAELKARAYMGKVDMPILANDTGFYVEGEGMINTPKRTALEGRDENSLTKEEIGKIMLEYWKNIARKYDGKADAAWVESFVLVDTDGNAHIADSRREIVLTDQEFGIPHPQMPVRALYYSKDTSKPAIQHTEEEELLEMQPIIRALREVISKVI